MGETVMERRNLIGNKWVDARSGERMNVVDPATDELVATVPSCAGEDARAAVDAAAEAWPAWRARPVAERVALLRRFAALVLERADDLARTMVREGGKPLGEARGEIVYAAS